MALARTSAVFLDVGFTLAFLDGSRIGEIAGQQGLVVAKRAVEAIERQARAELHQFSWAATPSQASSNPALAHGGERFFSRVLELAGAQRKADGVAAPPEERLRAGRAIWAAHLQRNVWSRIGEGVEEAVMLLTRANVPLAVVSNSEGTIVQLLREVGLAASMTTIVDSWVVDVAKPDPGIFEIALARLGVEPGDVTMVGDSLANDVRGGRAAGLRTALLDPFGDAEAEAEADVPRFPHLFAFVEAFLEAPRRA